MNSRAKQPRAPQISPALAAKSQRAIELHQQGQLAEAERLYRQILAAMPPHFDALHLLGVIKGQQNEFAAAVPFFEQALRVNPDSAAALNNFGNVLQALGRYAQALASYDRSLALRPDNPKGLMHRGNVLRKLSRPDEALASYDRALVLQPDYVDALVQRGGRAGRHGPPRRSHCRVSQGAGQRRRCAADQVFARLPRRRSRCPRRRLWST